MTKHLPVWQIIDLWSASSSSHPDHSSTAKTKISSPYNLVHVTHVGFDDQTGEFTGLPREWMILLQQSGITKREQQANPQVPPCGITACQPCAVLTPSGRLYWMLLVFTRKHENKCKIMSGKSSAMRIREVKSLNG